MDYRKKNLKNKFGLQKKNEKKNGLEKKKKKLDQRKKI